jgi:hypothetical protein
MQRVPVQYRFVPSTSTIGRGTIISSAPLYLKGKYLRHQELHEEKIGYLMYL